ncbi:hypothetical protein V2A60_009155 [Cordyceps javanica]
MNHNAKVCFVHFDDVLLDPAATAAEAAASPTGDGRLIALFQSARWLTRGWALQELLAPAFVRFYDKNWTPMTDEQSCLNALSAVTSIPATVLQDPSTICDAKSSCYVQTFVSATGGRKRLGEYSVTNLGIHIQLPILCSSPTSCVAVMDVSAQGSEDRVRAAIPLECQNELNEIWSTGPYFWRMRRPDGPVLLARDWAGNPINLFLARPGTKPGKDKRKIATLGPVRIARQPESRPPAYVLMTLERMQAGMPTWDLSTRAYTLWDLTSMRPTSAPNMWCGSLQLFGQDREQKPQLVTVIVQEHQGEPAWTASLSSASIAEVQRRAIKCYNNGFKPKSWGIQDQDSQPAENISDRDPVPFAGVETPIATTGFFAGCQDRTSADPAYTSLQEAD